MRTSSTKKTAPGKLASIRETVESYWIAMIMVPVLKTFILEAFVIPTGSMAPRLMGQHWQFDCPACGYHYAYGVPSRPGQSPLDLSRPLPPSGQGSEPGGSPPICPNCRHRHRFGKAWAYGGDRVLVLKYLYRFRQPKCWDVVVFKNPQDNEITYIKRLIGLPGQMIELVHGDVFFREGKDFNGDGVIDAEDFQDARAESECPWQILRKSPKTQEVMWQVVFDNDYLPEVGIYEAGDLAPWSSPWQAKGDPGLWDLNVQGGHVFAFAGSSEASELRFVAGRHRFCPNYAYNPPGKGLYDEEKDINSDLKLSFLFVPASAQAKVGLELSSFSHHFRAWLSAAGRCVLEHGLAQSGQVEWDNRPWAFRTLEPLELGRGHELALTHVERRVALWVDGEAVLETSDAQYPADREQILQAVAAGVPTPGVSIWASGGKSQLWHVRLMRDVYYTCANVYDADGRDMGLAGWGATGNPMLLRKFPHEPDRDEFYVLGDNSPSSKDSRMWGYHAPTLRQGYRDGTVPRYNVLGKAFFVYWPGGYRLPILKGLSLIPNVGRMRLVR